MTVRCSLIAAHVAICELCKKGEQARENTYLRAGLRLLRGSSKEEVGGGREAVARDPRDVVWIHMSKVKDACTPDGALVVSTHRALV